MISLFVLFLILVVVFTISGAVRGWPKELLALATQLITLFAIMRFAPTGFRALDLLFNRPFNPGQMFWTLAFGYIFVTFFAYQGSGALKFTSGRISREDQFKPHERFLGAILGCLNGYLFSGALLSFMEYRVIDGVWQRLDSGIREYNIWNRYLIRQVQDLDTFVYRYLPFELLDQNQNWLFFGFLLVFIFFIIAT